MKRTILAAALLVAGTTTMAPPASAGHHPVAGLTCGLAAAHNPTAFFNWDGTIVLGPVAVDPAAMGLTVTCTVQTTPTPGFGVVAAIAVAIVGNAMPPLVQPVAWIGVPPFYLCTEITWFPPGSVYEDDADHAAPGVQCRPVTTTFTTASAPQRPIVHVEP